MPAAVTLRANFRFASPTLPILPSRMSATTCIDVDVRGLDPLPTSPLRTIQPVLRSILLILLVPLHLKFEVEEPINMFQRDVLGRLAAPWRHVLRVCEGEGEDAAEAGVAHSVGAGEEGGAGGGVSGEAGEAFDFFFGCWWRLRG